MDHQNYIKPRAIYGAIAVAGVGFYAFHYVKTIREERAKRRRIDAELQRSLGAIGNAYNTVSKRLMNGEYDKSGNPIYEALMDLEFEQIIEYNKE